MYYDYLLQGLFKGESVILGKFIPFMEKIDEWRSYYDLNDKITDSKDYLINCN